MMVGTMKRTILVAGLGRCGSSLLMQMLAASGLRCAGDAPSYEFPIDWIEDDDGERDYIIPAEFTAKHDAVKVLWPARFTVETVPGAIVVWLDRNWREQARSLRKLAATVSRDVPPESSEVMAAMQKNLAEMRRASIRVLRGYPRLETSFENLIMRPVEAARDIAEFAAEYGITIDPAAMASVVESRSPRCAASLARERRLIIKEVGHGATH